MSPGRRVGSLNKVTRGLGRFDGSGGSVLTDGAGAGAAATVTGRGFGRAACLTQGEARLTAGYLYHDGADAAGRDPPPPQLWNTSQNPLSSAWTGTEAVTDAVKTARATADETQASLLLRVIIAARIAKVTTCTLKRFRTATEPRLTVTALG
jgi:hypothetical protein